MAVKIEYYAIFREQSGKDREELELKNVTAVTLFERLSDQYGFTVGRGQTRVAINDEFAAWSATLADGDSVVFIPPIAGG